MIPQSVDELTPAWFTQVLGHPAQVTHVESAAIGTDIGFMGELHRCTLTWADGAGGVAQERLPQSVVVKVPSNRPDNRALGEGLGSYEREIDVYRALQGSIGVSMPEHHFSIMDPDPAPWLERPVLFLFDKLPIGGVDWLLRQFVKLSGTSTRRYLLMIEDVHDARPPTQAEGGSLEDSKLALVALAGFHAANWMNQQAVEASRRILPLNTAPKTFQAAYRRNRDEFLAHFGDHLGPGVMSRLDEIQDRCREISDSLVAEPWTLIHGDYRLDNVLFRPNDELVVIDYQAVGWGRPGFDVAYFITTALSPEHKSAEAELLRTYHDALVESGVVDYSWDQLVADCEISKGLLAHRVVAGRTFLDSEVADSNETFVDLIATRILGWIGTVTPGA